MEKRCIFHVPTNIFVSESSGSTVRPKKMEEAFENIGYQVDCIWGYGEERKRAIDQIKYNIKTGVKYDFLYSENSTLPTLLTEKNHIPKYFCLDFGFFKFCKKHGIPIALFYRDIYWNVKEKEAKAAMKNCIKLFYLWDLTQYKKWLDIFYLPSTKMLDWIPVKNIGSKQLSLYPGGELNEEELKIKQNIKMTDKKSIHIFYVGGIGGLYNLSGLIEAVFELDFAYLTICCREKEWIENEKYYQDILCDRIRVVHESGESLKKYYEEADLCSLYFPPYEYRKMTMPVKTFEYLANMVPILASSESLAGEFILQNDVGWAVEFDKEKLKRLLKNLFIHREEIKYKRNNILLCMQKNSWENRAEQVVHDLESVGRHA